MSDRYAVWMEGMRGDGARVHGDFGANVAWRFHRGESIDAIARSIGWEAADVEDGFFAWADSNQEGRA